MGIQKLYTEMFGLIELNLQLSWFSPHLFHICLSVCLFVKQISSVVLLALIAVTTAYAPGYSYAKFSGPVSGPEKEVYVEHKDEHGHGHGHSVDYVANPDYHFAYGVEDPKSKVSQSRKESRHGDAVHGEYRYFFSLPTV